MKEIGAREKQLREQREANYARNHSPNPFEDAARGRDPAPKSSDGSAENKSKTRPLSHVPKGGAKSLQRPRSCEAIVNGAGVASGPSDAPMGNPARSGPNKAREIASKIPGVTAGKTALLKRGRPKKGEVRDKPWIAEGISKASWYRRQRGKK